MASSNGAQKHIMKIWNFWHYVLICRGKNEMLNDLSKIIYVAIDDYKKYYK